MTGKAATGAGAFVDLPAVGATTCPSILGRIGFATMAVQSMTGMLIGPLPLNPGGCIPGGPALVMTNGTGGFTMPEMFFDQPLPGAENVVPVPNVPVIVQLATSFSFTGPYVGGGASPWFEPKNPVITGTPYAPWAQFKHTAWTNQTGRASKDFAFCAPNVFGCTAPAGGTIPAIIKNFGGPGGGFGGTMGLVLRTGPNTSSLAAKIGAGQTILLNILAGGGSRAQGRGYAAFDTDVLAAGPQWGMYMLTGGGGPSAVIASVSSPMGNGPAGVNRNWGFPWTTGQVIVRGTGTAGGNIAGQTVTAQGFDTPTTMGGRNLQLVSGGVAQSTTQGANGTPNYSVLLLNLPEPGAVAQLLAGVVGLLGVAAWRSRRTR